MDTTAEKTQKKNQGMNHPNSTVLIGRTICQRTALQNVTNKITG
jgi:hypothetical protein